MQGTASALPGTQTRCRVSGAGCAPQVTSRIFQEDEHKHSFLGPSTFSFLFLPSLLHSFTGPGSFSLLLLLFLWASLLSLCLFHSFYSKEWDGRAQTPTRCSVLIPGYRHQVSQWPSCSPNGGIKLKGNLDGPCPQCDLPLRPSS